MVDINKEKVLSKLVKPVEGFETTTNGGGSIR